jgi:polyribonucleotide nucleotidyltransferase
MDVGVPIKSMVAGIAMGLVMGEDGNHSILSDIEGMEDHLGDMDFKVAGTEKGINALQMDIKVKGLTDQILAEALRQAKEGRLFILDKMSETISASRPELNPYAPTILRINIPEEKIGAVIGPGGRTIRAISKDSDSTIDLDDAGVVTITSTSKSNAQRAREKVEALTRDVEVGDIFTGRVVRLTNFGAFVELMPGKDGLVRSVDLGDDLEDGVTVGQEITVMVVEIDPLGRMNLSRRALMEGDGGAQSYRGGPSRPPFNRSGGSSSGPGGFRPRPGQGPGRQPNRGSRPFTRR